MTDKETPASSNSDETARAQTTTEALEWHAPVMVRIDEHTTIPHLLKERVQRGATSNSFPTSRYVAKLSHCITRECASSDSVRPSSSASS